MVWPLMTLGQGNTKAPGRLNEVPGVTSSENGVSMLVRTMAGGACNVTSVGSWTWLTCVFACVTTGCTEIYDCFLRATSTACRYTNMDWTRAVSWSIVASCTAVPSSTGKMLGWLLWIVFSFVCLKLLFYLYQGFLFTVRVPLIYMTCDWVSPVSLSH